MTRRVCREPGCPVLVDTKAYRGRCTKHQRDYERRRGTRQERGYDKQYDQDRAALVRRLEAGETIRCWKCGDKLTAQTLRLDHNETRTGYRGPACDTCNSSLAGQASHSLGGGG